ncbi:MAG: AI-2E family transporter, partial [Oscillospiraceae bacterium]|nr:AI-2E family transporter [Oscillospiraceae bacterium]
AQTTFANEPELLQWLNSLSIDWRTIDWQEILNKVINFLKNGAGDVLNSTISVAKGFFSGIASAFVSFVFACYLLLQKEKLALQCRKVFFALFSQQAATRVIDIASLSQRIFSSFITGQCLEAVILGLMFFVTMSILGMPYPLLVGCLIAVTALIPIVGAFIGCGVGAFLILMVSPMKALIFVIMFLILQQIEGNLIYPHVVGNSVGLPSIWVLAAVSIGGSLMGVIGMLTFIPLVSVVYTLFREFVYKRLSDKNISVI